jgi:hypothetical protein
MINNQSKFDKAVGLKQLRQNPPPEGPAALSNVNEAVALWARDPLAPIIVTVYIF